MVRLINICRKITIIFVFFISLSLVGCKGTDTREDIDDTVEELAGKKSIERMEDMKKDIGKIKEKQTERLEQFDDEQ